MDDKKIFRHVLIVGFAIFSTFFGAGNMIFPAKIGFQSGNGWELALFGFALSGIVLPLLTIISVGNNETLENITDKVHPVFSKVFVFVVFVIVLGLIGLPRIGGVVYELGASRLMPDINNIVVAVMFFGLTIYLTLKRTNVVEIMGKYLAPILLVFIGIIILTGIFSPIGTPSDTGATGLFTAGFFTGYWIGDAVVGLVIASIFISAIKDLGYKSDGEIRTISILSGIIAASLLLFVYGGLLYIAATGSAEFDSNLIMTELVAAMTEKLLGKAGLVFLSISVIFACLTTSVGATAAFADFIDNLTKKKFSYKSAVICISTIAGLLSITGVEKIMQYAMPILVFVYPIVIVLIFFGIFSKYITNRGAYIGGIVCSAFTSIFITLDMFGFASFEFLGYLPFHASKFGWVAPSLAGLTIGWLIFSARKTKQ